MFENNLLKGGIKPLAFITNEKNPSYIYIIQKEITILQGKGIKCKSNGSDKLPLIACLD